MLCAAGRVKVEPGLQPGLRLLVRPHAGRERSRSQGAGVRGEPVRVVPVPPAGVPVSPPGEDPASREPARGETLAVFIRW
jgi:hypothetical protein